MKELERLIEAENNKEFVQKLKYATYLYKDLMTATNHELLDEYTKTLIDVLTNTKKTINEKRFSNYILEYFYLFLIKNGKTPKTAYDYVKRVERICKEYKITVEDLFNRKSGYSINDLIGMYSPNGMKSDENKKKHNAPLSALKQFRDFMENRETITDVTPFYLCETEGYQSWETMSKHPCVIEIDGRNCTITFKENRVICDKVSKIINNTNYNELLNVFRKYKSILSNNKTSILQSFPYGGVHSYKYQFEDQSNYSGCATLFESSNRKLEEQAYQEYHDIIEKIIN